MPFQTYDQIMAKATEENKNLCPSSNQDSKPETILVAASPEQINEAKSIKIEELESSLGFKFTERLWAPKVFLEDTLSLRQARGDRHYESNSSPTDSKKDWKATIRGYSTREILHHHTGTAYGTFMLVNMGACGYGLMTRVEIKPNQFLFNYTGEYISSQASEKQHSLYKLVINDTFFGCKESVFVDNDDPLYAFRDNSVDKEGVIDAKRYRNFSAFALHAPSICEIGIEAYSSRISYLFESQKSLDKVATENTTTLRGKSYIDGLSAHQFHSSRVMDPYTLVFINYGTEYWSSQGCQPELFTPHGRVIKHKRYYPVWLYLENTFDATRPLIIETSAVFTALLNKQGLEKKFLPYETLRDLTKQHLGEERFRAHLGCFLRKNPEVVLGYRKNRFIKRVEMEKDQLDNLKPRMEHFGFRFFNEKQSTPQGIDLKNSTPKIPLKAINSI